MNNFKKTAQNFHYEFNIRHISNVFQGLMVSNPDQFHQSEKFVHLWLHESERVYGDRLSLQRISQSTIPLCSLSARKVFPDFEHCSFLH